MLHFAAALSANLTLKYCNGTYGVAASCCAAADLDAGELERVHERFAGRRANNRRGHGDRGGLDKGTLAAAPIGLRWAGLRGQPDRRQAYEPPPLVKSAARFRLLRMSPAVLENLGT